MKVKTLLPLITLLGTTGIKVYAQNTANAVKITGEMKNVMWKGQLSGNIRTDTIANKTHLYGMGPLEYLAGEILILDGKFYKSTVVDDTKMRVEETEQLKAPFFCHANIASWNTQSLPDSIQVIKQLEQYLDQITRSSQRPFLFQLSGTVEQATIHVVNLPKGSTVGSPDDAHKGQVNYMLRNEEVNILGFFSTRHQAVFTHHDSFLHMHLINADRKKMGHLDEVLFKKGTMKLFLPAE